MMTREFFPRLIESLTAFDAWLAALLILALGWGLHRALAQSKPRWRVLLWSAGGAGVLLVLLLETILPVMVNRANQEDIVQRFDHEPQPVFNYFNVEIKPFAELLRDQVYYHTSHTTLTEKEVCAHFEGQERGVNTRYGGHVYAYGYLVHEKGKPLRAVFAPVRGGRIHPAQSGVATHLEFYDAQGNLLTTATPPGFRYGPPGKGGNSANIPRFDRVEGGLRQRGNIRDFECVFSVSTNTLAMQSGEK